MFGVTCHVMSCHVMLCLRCVMLFIYLFIYLFISLLIDLVWLSFILFPCYNCFTFNSVCKTEKKKHFWSIKLILKKLHRFILHETIFVVELNTRKERLI